MAEIKKRKTRMYEPWGYRDENNYQGMGIILENDLDSFFAEVAYNKDDNMIHFSNKDGEEKAAIDVSEFVKSDTIVERAWYEDGKIYIKFTNGDVITIDVEELIDQNEFADGLQVNEGVVSVLIDGESEDFLTVGENGVKLAGVQDAIDAERNRAIAAEEVLDAKIEKEINDRITDVDEEESRAINAETALDEKIGTEITRAEAAEQAIDEKIEAETARATGAETSLDEKIEAETTRATSEEQRIDAKLDQEITDRKEDVDTEEVRAKAAEQALDVRIGTLNDAITNEKTRAEAAEQELSARLTTEITDRKADVDEEEARAKAAEQALDGKIEQEIADRKAEAVASAEYVSGDVKIYLKNDNGETLSEIDCSDFIVDGMIEDVELVASGDTSVLVITWNLDGGSKTTTIDVGDIFEADNYYTKVEIDGKETALQNAIAAEETRAKNVEQALQESINGEQARAEAAEALKADKSEITDMATKTWVGEQGFLTEHQSLEDYAKTADVNAALELKADKTEIPTDFYTQEQVNAMMSQLLTRIENLEDKEGVVVADDASSVDAAAAGSNLVLTSTEAIQALTAGTEYNTLTIVGGSANNGDIKAKATNKFTVDGMAINGDKGASNGRVLISASTVDLKNVTIETGSTAYNVFEGTQNTADSSFFTSTYNVSNLTADNTALNHNIVNIYTPANGAVINIKDCNLNLDVDKSNLLRMANYTNATGVTINFENVEWTYENALASDWKWAGLMIFQPSTSDIALTGDTSAISTWTVNVKNCKYNGEKVTSNNFGGHNQVVYLYDINHTGAVTDADSVMTINFE